MDQKHLRSLSMFLAHYFWVASMQAEVASAFLPPSMRTIFSKPVFSSKVSVATREGFQSGNIGKLSFLLGAYSDSIPISEGSKPKTHQGDETSGQDGVTSISARISDLIHQSSSSNTDVLTQEKGIEQAEQLLIQWIDDYRSGRNPNDNNGSNYRAEEIVDAVTFDTLIRGILTLPSSFQNIPKGDADNAIERVEQNILHDELRSLIGKGKSSSAKKGNQIVETYSKSDRATFVLDLMESFHEPRGDIYDEVIASHGTDALDCLSHVTGPQFLHVMSDTDHSDNSKQEYFNRAWKSAKSALQLLNRSEELYRETGSLSSRLPSISSYVTMIDVWKAIAVCAEESDRDEGRNDHKRDEAMEIVRNLRQRRLEVYSLESNKDDNGNDIEEASGRYNILPLWATESVDGVLEFASDVIRENVPTYQPKREFSGERPSKVGTWHFNQVIFDLGEYPRSFSGPLAQDLLEFMVLKVRKESPRVKQNDEKIMGAMPIVPKPNTDTINAVLKAWMVTPGAVDSARRAEAVLAQLATWQADGTLWGVNPDIVSYNTCINCWKESGIPGAAERATDILTLLEDETTDVFPDVVTYGSCMAAWAALGAGRRAEEILLRMYKRSLEGSSSSLPKPSTRCFNAVFLAYANGKEEGRGKRALELLRFMERLHSEGYEDVMPDTYTFNIVMKALTNCGEIGAAQKARQLLRRMEDSNSDGDIQLNPDSLSYNTVLDAFAKEGDAVSAEKLLNEMHSRTGKSMKSAVIAKPDTYSYTSVLNAWAKHEDKTLALKKAEELFNELERKYAAGETDVRADSSVYNALINCWAKSGDRKALYRVTQLLNLMEELGLQGGDSNVEPNSRTYCTVLDALSRSKSWKAVSQSLEILTRMEEFYSEGHECVRPCARAYSIVISTIARSKKKGKAELAQEILHRMESEYRKGNDSARPTVYSYNAVLNAAAFTNGDEKEQEQAFKVACLTFDELRNSDYLRPSHVSYGTFLKAIEKLMPESDVRNDLVKGLFRRCCRDGQVGDLVLRSMKSLTTPDLYQSLLEGVADYGLPKSWSANVRERDSKLRT